MPNVYFGTRDRMKWVKAPAINTSLSSVGSANTGTDLNGGGYSKISPTSHKEYQFTWGASPGQDIYAITDYRSGVYGDGLIYYNDPFAMEHNLLCSQMAYPREMYRANRFSVNSATYETTTPANTLDLPIRGVSLPLGVTSRKQYIPVPPGYTLHVAYVATGNSLNVGGSVAAFTPVAATSFTWTTYTTGVDIYWSAPAPVTVFAAIAVLIPTGKLPNDYAPKWRMGKGHSGLRFAGEPQITGITAALGGVSGLLNATANFTETGLWEL